jgi:hypothetical protein
MKKSIRFDVIGLIMLTTITAILIVATLLGQRSAMGFAQDLLIYPNRGGIFATADSLVILWLSSEPVQSIYLIPDESECKIEEAGLIEKAKNIRLSSFSGCRRIGLYSDIGFGDPVNLSGSYVHILKDSDPLIKPGDYYVMLITPTNTYDVSDSVITIQK